MGRSLDRATKATAEKKAAFLAAYARVGTITHAAEEVGLNRITHYKWVEHDELYAAAFRGAEAEALDSLEREGRRRAVEGTEEPVFHQGEVVGHIRRYSDTLLIFLLKGHNPTRYRDRVDVTLNVRSVINQIAGARGLDPDEVLAEAERILAETT